MNPKWMPTHLGAEPKKLAALGVLVAALAGVLWMNETPTAPTPQAKPIAAIPSSPAVNPPRAPLVPSMPVPRRRVAGNNTAAGTDNFRPTLTLPEDTDVSAIDPALHLELLARSQSDASAGARSLFEFSQPAPPPPPKVEPIKVGPVKPATPPPPPPVSNEPPKPPPPPPIPLKYYGFAGNTTAGQRRAFFLDGEDIFVAGENEVVKGRYRIVRIGVNSAVVEDTQNKSQQTLPLVEETAG